jgi:predicted RNA binding protein YcfA (HicA-like mRNA interferase family)
MKTPSLNYTEILRALQRGGWVVVRQEGSHIRLRKRLPEGTLNITLPAHKPVKRSTLAHILKQARLTTEEFLDLF